MNNNINVKCLILQILMINFMFNDCLVTYAERCKCLCGGRWRVPPVQQEEAMCSSRQTSGAGGEQRCSPCQEAKIPLCPRLPWRNSAPRAPGGGTRTAAPARKAQSCCRRSGWAACSRGERARKSCAARRSGGARRSKRELRPRRERGNPQPER